MTESACLHIQDRESSPIRVVELPGISVRIGRALHCEIQLTALSAAEEVCRLSRRGRSWQLVPSGKGGPIRLEGRPLSGACALPFDVPFFIGTYCLTLRHDRAAEPDWDSYHTPAPPDPRVDQGKPPLSAQKPPMPPRETQPAPAVEKPVRSSPTDVREPSSRERWESRWKAVSAEIKARSDRAVNSPEPLRPAFAGRLDPVPIKEPSVPRAQPVAPPSPPPVVPPVARAAPPRVERPDLRPKAEPSRDFAPADPPWTRLNARETTGGSPARARPETADRPPPSWADWLSSVPDLSKAAARPVTIALPVPPRAEPAAAAPAGKPEAKTSLPADSPPAERAIEQETLPCTRAADCGDTVQALEPDAGPIVRQGFQPDVLHSDLDEPFVPDAPSDVERASQHDVAPDAGQAFQPDIPTAGQAFQPDIPPDVREAFEPALRRNPGPACEPDDQPEPAAHRQPPEPPLSRTLARPRYADQNSAIQPVRDVEWPSARDILASHRAVPRPALVPVAARKASGSISKAAAMPTLARRPDQWSAPWWLAGPPVAFFVLAAGLAGCVLSWRWAGDSFAAVIVTDRLLTPDRTARSLPLPESVSPPEGSWTSTTAAGLSRWAVYLRYFQPELAISRGETARSLERALQVSPLDRVARLALDELEATAEPAAFPVRALGLSRDAVSLSFSARSLLAAGQKQAALKMYGRALALALPNDSFRTGVPQFSDDAAVSRYLLPGEHEVREVLRELLSAGETRFSDWLDLLPRDTVVVLAAGRLLHEQGRAEAPEMLNRVLAEPPASDSGDENLALALAARAEAFALLAQWRDADRVYRQAIELAGDDTIRRSWWFNLADVAARLEDDDKRQAALQAAMAVPGSDDIARRAADVQRASRPRAEFRKTGLKAN